MLIAQYASNKIVNHDTNNATTWHIVGTDSTGAIFTYTSLALLLAAGKKPWPGLDTGCFVQYFTTRSEDGSGNDGSQYYFAFNQGAAFAALASDTLRDLQGHLVSASGQHIVAPGSLWNVWIRKTVGTDYILLEVGY